MKPQTLTHILTVVLALGFGLTAQTTVASPDKGTPGGNTDERTSAVPAAPDVSPPPDGGYPGFTTAEGLNALKNLTSGLGNSAFGWYSLFSKTTANYNSGLGAGTMALNSGAANIASGIAALILTTEGTRNTTNGAAAMVSNSTATTTPVRYFSLYKTIRGQQLRSR
jgi:hypothetical protein